MRVSTKKKKNKYDSSIPERLFSTDQYKNFHIKTYDKVPDRNQYNQCSHSICTALSQRIQTRQISSWCQSAQWPKTNEDLCIIQYMDKQHSFKSITKVIRFHFQILKPFRPQETQFLICLLQLHSFWTTFSTHSNFLYKERKRKLDSRSLRLSESDMLQISA